MTETAAKPLPVLPLDYADASRMPSRWRTTLRWLAPISWIASFVAWVLIFYEVETVLVSGPLLAIAGIVILVGAIQIRNARAGWCGAGQVGVPVLLLLLVNLLDWNPAQARRPFLYIGAAYLGVAPVILAMMFARNTGASTH